MSQRHARAGVRLLALPPGFSFTGLPVLKPLRCADQSQRALNELRQAHTLTAETHSRLTNALPHTSTHTNTHKHTSTHTQATGSTVPECPFKGWREGFTHSHPWAHTQPHIQALTHTHPSTPFFLKHTPHPLPQVCSLCEQMPCASFLLIFLNSLHIFLFSSGP